MSAINAPKNAKDIQGISGYVPVKNKCDNAVLNVCASTLWDHSDEPIASGKTDGRKIVVVSIGIHAGAPLLLQ